MLFIKNIISYLFVAVLGYSVFICVQNQKYEFAIALAGVCVPILTPFFTKDIEIDKLKAEKLSNNNIDLYPEFNVILSELQYDVRAIKRGYEIYVFNEKSKIFHKEMKEKFKDDLTEEEDAQSLEERNKKLHINTSDWMKKFSEDLGEMYKFYAENNTYFSQNVTKSYDRLVNSRHIVNVTTRWHNCNLEKDVSKALSWFFASYHQKDLLNVEKNITKLKTAIKKELGVC